jgi:hypothetical protein
MASRLMPVLPYEVCDVFTDRPLTGNALAVFTDAGRLPAEQMQALARETNLSESAFVLPPTTTDAHVRIRIFTPTMDLVTWSVIVPASLASLVTGIVSSVGTPWGLLRHYWVVVKLLLNVVATLLLLLHTRPVGDLATAAVRGALAAGSFRALRVDLVVDAGGGLLALLAATALGLFKPKGLTRYGWRKERGG